MDRRNAKKQAVLESAGDVFMRHGFARTTMGMIAEAAGVSRPALYLLFTDKEDIFSAVVQRMNDLLIAEIAMQITGIEDFEARLQHACEAWTSSVFDVHSAHAEAKDMDDLSFPAVRAIYERLESFVATIMADGYRGAKTAEIATSAHMLVYALRGCRLGATDKADMRRMSRLLVASVCRMRLGLTA